MVTVPNVAGMTPHLAHNPVIVYVSDHFQKPTPFAPDVIVPIDETIEAKIDMLHCHTSQFYEWLPYNSGDLDAVPAEPERRTWLRQRYDARLRRDAERFRDMLIAQHGPAGAHVRYAEAFEGCEYGTPLTAERIPQLFPFFDR